MTWEVCCPHNMLPAQHGKLVVPRCGTHTPCCGGNKLFHIVGTTSFSMSCGQQAFHIVGTTSFSTSWEQQAFHFVGSCCCHDMESLLPPRCRKACCPHDVAKPVAPTTWTLKPVAPQDVEKLAPRRGKACCQQSSLRKRIERGSLKVRLQAYS